MLKIQFISPSFLNRSKVNVQVYFCRRLKFEKYECFNKVNVKNSLISP